MESTHQPGLNKTVIFRGSVFTHLLEWQTSKGAIPRSYVCHCAHCSKFSWHKIKTKGENLISPALQQYNNERL